MNNSVLGLVLLPVGLLSVLWADGSLAQLDDSLDAAAKAAADERLGLFRVWNPSSDSDSTQSFSKYEALLNEESRQQRAAAQSDPRLGCRVGMPAVMFGPTEIEVLRGTGDDQILLRLPAYDIERVIHMDSEGDGVAQEPTSSALGFSIGHWDHDYLIIETTLVDSPYFDTVGTPISDQAWFFERFEFSRLGGDAIGEKHLNYRLTTIDRGTFTGPVVLDRFWDRIPGGGAIEPDECPAE